MVNEEKLSNAQKEKFYRVQLPTDKAVGLSIRSSLGLAKSVCLTQSQAE